MITKKMFVEILDMLESDCLIDDFQFYKNENIIKVYSDRDDIVIYHFDENDNLINPQIFKIQKEIEKLEIQKKDLESKLNLLTYKLNTIES